MLKLEIRQDPPQSIWLIGKVRVGKNVQNDIVLNADGIDGFHLVFEAENQSVMLIDKSSTGTFVNGKHVVDRIQVKSGDWITIGSIEMDIVDPKQMIFKNHIQPAASTDGWMLKAITGWLAGQEIPIEQTVVIGRDEECDITVAGTHLSLRHAEISIQENCLHIKDFGSVTGTFLNGVRITEADVVSGDEIRFDLLSFLVIGPAGDTPQHRKLKTKAAPNVHINNDPAVRIGEAKPTSMGNSEEYVAAYNEQLKMLKKEKKRQKRDLVLGWIIIAVIVALSAAIIYFLTH